MIGNAKLIAPRSNRSYPRTEFAFEIHRFVDAFALVQHGLSLVTHAERTHGIFAVLIPTPRRQLEFVAARRDRQPRAWPVRRSLAAAQLDFERQVGDGLSRGNSSVSSSISRARRTSVVFALLSWLRNGWRSFVRMFCDSVFHNAFFVIATRSVASIARRIESIATHLLNRRKSLPVGLRALASFHLTVQRAQPPRAPNKTRYPSCA